MTAIPKQLNRHVGQAMHQYKMLADKDRVMIAVSGGIDSLVLTWLLHEWIKKAPIKYELLAVHLDMGFGGDEIKLVEQQLARLNTKMILEQTNFGPEALAAENGKSGCFHCARKRRNRLFAMAQEHNCNKIAFGHHKEDIIETLFLNIFYGGNISTMLPKQELFNGKLAIIRPLAFATKKTIIDLGNKQGITPVANPCRLSNESNRMKIRSWLETLYKQEPDVKASIFASMANVKTDYLLTPGDK